MSLFASYSSFVLALVLIVNTSVLLYMVFSYRKRLSDLKERTDKTITHLDQQLERSGIVLAETRKKVKDLENHISYYKNGGIDPGINTAIRRSSASLYENTTPVTKPSVNSRQTLLARNEQEEARRRSETSSYTSTNDLSSHQLNMFAIHNSADIYTVRPTCQEPADKPAYVPYVNSGCSTSRSDNYNSGNSGSSSSDSCSSSSSSD